MRIGSMLMSAGIVAASAERIKDESDWMNWLALALGVVALALNIVVAFAADKNK